MNYSHVIGFTTQFFTLWSISEPYKHYTSKTEFRIQQDAIYYQNLSHDLDEAQRKAREILNIDHDLQVDRNLRGESRFSAYISGQLETDVDADLFPYGKLFKNRIDESHDAWQLDRLRNDERERFAQHAENALKRMIELELLVKFEDEYLTEEEIRLTLEARERNSRQYGFFYSEGERVELELQVISQFTFKSQYGYNQLTKVFVFQDEQKCIFKYIGSSWLEDQNGEYANEREHVKLTATIAHKYDNYAECEMTFLKRPRVKEVIKEAVES